MKLRTFVKVALAIAATIGSTGSYAGEPGTSIIYLGGGAGDSGDYYKSSRPPVTLGILNISNQRGSVWGVDISGEGTMLNSTGGRYNAVEQGTSFNLLLGSNMSKSEDSRFDAAFLVGMRRTELSCPRSYLGYQCYADESPKSSYGFNYGALLAVTYKSLMFGVRATGESAQALLGFRF